MLVADDWRRALSVRVKPSRDQNRTLKINETSTPQLRISQDSTSTAC